MVLPSPPPHATSIPLIIVRFSFNTRTKKNRAHIKWNQFGGLEMTLQIIRRFLLQLSWNELHEKTSLWLARRAGGKSFNEGLRLQPGSLQKQVAKLHFFTDTAVMVTTTPTCVTCGRQEEASFGITKRNGHFNYQNLFSYKKKSYKLAALSKSFFLFFFCLTNSGFFAAADSVFPWDEKKVFKGKMFLKNEQSRI